MAEQIIRVFISSTLKDFEEERKSVKEAIQELNDASNLFEIALLPVDLKSGARPNPSKEECLREVAKSQVIIGLLGYRYGEVDTKTGKSITELEYDKACEIGLPILMYIRIAKIEPDWIDTDKELIKKREEFRQKVELRHKRDTFKESNELRGHVLRDLNRTVLEKFASLRQEQKIESVESPPVPQADTEISEPVGEKKVTARVVKIQQLLKSISTNISDIKKVDGQKRRRLYLLAASMFHHTELSGTLGNHEIQLLYGDRKSLSPIGTEMLFLARNVLSDEYGVKAGWFWLRDFSSDDIHKHLRWLCMNEGDKDTRVGCLRLLMKFPSEITEEIICKNITNVTKEICLAALHILKDFGTTRSLSVLHEAEKREDGEIKKTSRKAIFAVLLRNNPVKASSFITELEDVDGFLSVREFTNAFQEMDIAALKKLRSGQSENINKLATKELLRKGEIDDEELHELTNSSDEEIRYLAYKILIYKGEQFDPQKVRESWVKEESPYSSIFGSILRYGRIDWLDKVILNIFQRYSTSKLEKSIKWFDLNAKLCYLAWGLQGTPQILNQVRKDLEGQFERIKKTHLAELNELRLRIEKDENIVNLKVVQEIIDKFDNYDDSTRPALTESALKIMIAHGEKGDIKFAKEFMTSKEIKLKGLAVELFVKLAGKDHLSTLIDIALEETGKINTEAADKALKIDKEGLAWDKFLSSKDVTLVKLSLKKKINEKELVEGRIIDELLHHWNVEIQKIVIAYLIEAFGRRRKKLEQVLERYMESKTYYYNVVCWLDRVLYAPKSFKMMFRKELAAKFE